MRTGALIICLLALIGAAVAAAQTLGPVPTPRVTFKDTYIGEPITTFSARHQNYKCQKFPGAYKGEQPCSKEHLEPIGAAEADVTYSFLDEWGSGGPARLYKINGEFRDHYYSAIREAFVEKFGIPDEKKQLVLTNRLGAKFEREILIWRAAEVSVVLTQYGNNFGASDTYHMNFGEFIVTHAPSYRFVEQKLKERRGGKL